MLAALTATAISRGWPPAVFARLVMQLCDTSNIPVSDQASELYNCLTTASVGGPLQYEYMLVLSSDQQSVLFFPAILNELARQNWRERNQPTRELMCYLARAIPTCWSLSPDYTDISLLCDCINTILNQALEGCEESRLLVSALTHTNIIAVLNQLNTHWKNETFTKFQSIRLKSVIDDPKYAHVPSSFSNFSIKPGVGIQSDQAVISDVGLSDSIDNNTLRSSRSLRFLWLDWLLRTSQELDNISLKKQLDLMWPGDRIPVISYELCVSAFDVVAAPACFPNASPSPALSCAFIVKRLPLILRLLAQPESYGVGLTVHERSEEDGKEVVFESSTKSLDGVIARLFTTMDKEVVEAVEQRHPGLREQFGISCVDLGLCDPTVLHALHRSYTPQAEPSLPDSVIGFDLRTFSSYNPENQGIIAREILESARGTHPTQSMGRHHLAELCIQIYKNVEAADELFVHIPIRDFLESVCVNADAASMLTEEEGCSGLIYDDLGILLGSAKLLTQRYNIKLPDQQAPWSTVYLKTTLFSHASQLSQQKQTLMGQWVIALFSKSSGGIADELFRPFNELSEVLPALIQQAVKAYQSGVIDRDVLKNGLEHFANPYMSKLMAPLILRILHTDLLQTIHQSSMALECIVFLLQILADKQLQPNNNMEITISYVLLAVEPILRDMMAIMSSKSKLEHGTSQTETKLTSILESLVLKLTQANEAQLPMILEKWDNKQINGTNSTSRFKKEDTKSTAKPTLSLAESAKSAVSALMSWQTKPHGVPAVPSVIVSAYAKPVLGPENMRDIIESVCFPQSPETAVAIFVADGLTSKTSRMADVGIPNTTSETAQKFISQFATIISQRDTRVRPNIVIVPTSTHASKSLKKANATVDAASTFQVDQVLPQTDNNHANKSTSLSPVNTSPGVAIPFDMDMMLDEGDPVQGMSFDTDFASHPMNLEDLDSAMDFGWD